METDNEAMLLSINQKTLEENVIMVDVYLLDFFGKLFNFNSSI